jgi:hypothetical protein
MQNRTSVQTCWAGPNLPYSRTPFPVGRSAACFSKADPAVTTVAENVDPRNDPGLSLSAIHLMPVGSSWPAMTAYGQMSADSQLLQK